MEESGQNFEPKEEETALEVLVRGLEGEGRKDSEGQFSINYGAARKKLAQFQLPSPSHYILKFLQAAFWADSDRVELNLSRRGADFEIFGWSPDASALANALCQPDLKTSEAQISALAVGLNSVLAQGAEIAVVFPGIGESDVLLLGESLRWCFQSESADNFSILIKWPPTALRSKREDQRILIERCFCYPLPFIVNGKPFPKTERPSWDQVSIYEEHIPGETILAEETIGVDAGHAFVRASLGTEAFISVMRGGVVSDIVRMDLEIPGLDLLIDGETLNTDLTGLQIREDEAFEDLLSSFALDPISIREKAMDTLRKLNVSSAPATLGQINSTLVWVGALVCLYLGVKLYMIAQDYFDPNSSLLALFLPFILFFLVAVKGDKIGIRLFRAPDNVSARMREKMMDKLRGL